MAALDTAFLELTQALGVDRVSRDPDRIARYGRSNVLGSPMPAGVLRPADRAQTVAAVRIASRHRVPLYPISRGQNWGYGAACPVSPGHLVVDLGDLNRILEVNEQLAYAVVEPGVTLRQLHLHLRAHGSPLWMDCTDSAPDTSVLGNIVDRGTGFSAYGDRFGAACALEVVLADGTVVETGFSHYPNARTRHTHKWGVGPSVDGLFTQSSYGLVLRLTTWLMKEPEAFLAVFVATPPEHFERLIDTLRDLRLEGVLPSTVHQAPLRWLSPLAAEGSFYTIGALYGPQAVVDACRATLLSTLGEFSVCTFADVRQGPIELDEAFLRAAGVDPASSDEEAVALRKKIALNMKSFADIHRGVPMSDETALITPHPSVNDAELPKHGHYSYGLSCPAVGRDAGELLSLITRVYEKHGRKYTGPSIAHVNPRTLLFIAHLVFDRTDDASARGAKALMDELIPTAIAEGFPPYRVGIQSMGQLDPVGSGYWAMARRLKAALDPDGIFSNGRYMPPPPST